MVIKMVYIPHIFGFFALITWLGSIQVKKKSEILIFQLLANILYSIQYFLLGFFSTGTLNIVSSCRSLFFAINAKKNKENPLWLLILILSLIFIVAMIFCNSFISLIPVLATILYSISSWQNNTRYLRIVFIICAILYAFYNFIAGAYISLIGNWFEVISGTLAIYRFQKEVQK